MPTGPMVTAPGSIRCLHCSCQAGAAEIPCPASRGASQPLSVPGKGRKQDNDGRLHSQRYPGHQHLVRSQPCYYPSPGPRVTDPWCCRVSRLSPWLETQLLLPQHLFHFCHHRAGVEFRSHKEQELTPDGTKPSGLWHRVPKAPGATAFPLCSGTSRSSRTTGNQQPQGHGLTCRAST